MTQPADYRVIQKILHWLMAILVMLDLFVAQKFGDFMEDWDRLESRMDHASLGLIIGTLFLLRLFFRILYGAPPLPVDMPGWQIKAARLVHFALYFFIGCLLISGIATAVNATSPLAVFNAIEITRGNTDENFFRFLRQFHEFSTWAVITLIVGHILASLHHHFIIKDDTTIRMLKFWQSRSAE